MYTGNKLAEFHGNILSLSENIAKSFRGGGLFFIHTVLCSNVCVIICRGIGSAAAADVMVTK